MKLILKEDNQYILRIDKGEEFIEALEGFARIEEIKSAYFSAIGAAENAELAYYNIHAREFSLKTFKEPLEILNITGNIAMKEERVIVHAHGILGDNEMRLFGGHINRLLISTVAEVYLAKFERVIQKVYSEEIGLNVME